MSDKFIDIDVKLLVLRYGRDKVLAALARLVEQTPAEIEHQLQTLERRPAIGRKNKPSLSLTEVAESECASRAEIFGVVRTLAIAFDSRSFLPNLRDVHRFLDRIGAPNPKLKSRDAAGPVVIRALSKLPADQLANLASTHVSSGESDYALLSRAIMGGPNNERERK